MLTKQDLNLIRGVVKEEVESGLAPVSNDISGLKKDVKKLRKDLSKTIEFFDKTDITLLKKINKTRTDIGLPELNFA